MMSGALCWSNIKLKNIIGNYELLLYQFHLILIKCFENNNIENNNKKIIIIILNIIKNNCTLNYQIKI